MKSKRLKRLAIFASCLLLLGVVFITRVDWEPYQQKAYYQQTVANIDSVANVSHPLSHDTLRVGWGQGNITPPHGGKLISYGWRGHYKTVHDSAYVKAFVFAQGQQTVALLTYSLWIMHPALAASLRKEILAQYPQVSQTYFTASHTHSGFGGWGSGLAGHLLIGGNNPATVAHIQKESLAAIGQAFQNMRKSKLGYGQVDAHEWVLNRLDRKKGDVDPWLRVVKIEQDGGKQALLYTYSAHSTFLTKKNEALSDDYSGPVSAYLMQSDTLGVDMAAYASGAVGSHSPVRNITTLGAMRQFSKRIAVRLAQSIHQIETRYVTDLRGMAIPIALRSPHIRITKNWRLRPWVFRWLFGANPAEISCLKIGHCLFMGMPCELSGEFYPELSLAAQAQGLNLMITTFNGAYLGYVTPDKYYNTRNHAETRMMNWYGPYNGDYFTEISKKIIALF